ncbi:MAG: flagellar biosynthesis sigma factor [Gammaproteobacteria bacterium SG8_47]|nr:MAG: flagellar biosynthesis sigma factor [Gammaproteobacteria bacterium SG8_47]
MKPHKEQYPSQSRSSDDQLLTQHAGLVKRVAYHLAARLPSSVAIDDLIQAGMLGLLDAARLYDASQGASFETYARIRIRGAMLDELRRNDWAPKSVHARARELEESIRRIEAQTGRDARDHEVASLMNISIEDYHRILQDASSCSVLSFEDAGVDPDSVEPPDQQRSSEPLSALIGEQFRQRLAAAVGSLPERERLIVSYYYDLELNLREIGVILGVSESRVSQLMSQAHLRLRARLGDDPEFAVDD